MERKVLYAEVRADVKKPITSERAKSLLGWTIADDKSTEPVLPIRDRKGRRICCRNNVRNRFLTSSNVLLLKQEILRRRWRMNGEPVIVGMTGILLNGQHCLVALVLAAEEWTADPSRWPAWEEEPSIRKIVTYGIEETDDVVNTMDTCRPRSLAEVIYRSAFFAGDGLRERECKECARMTDYAVRLLWHRTGAGLDAFAPRRTHAESLDFLARHPKLLDAVRHVREENGGKDGRILKYTSPGCMAGLTYLFAAGMSVAETYFHGDPPREELLDLSLWNRACEFVVLLASGDLKTKAVRQYLAQLANDGADSNSARWGILVNAWLAFAEDKPVTPSLLRLDFAQDEESGRRTLTANPSCGGIDLGDPSEVDEAKVPKVDPTPQEIKQRTQELRTRKASLVPAKKGKEWAKDDVAWVYDAEGQHYVGCLTEDPVGHRVLVKAKDGTWDVDVSNLSLTQPESVATPKPPRIPETDGNKVAAKKFKKKVAPAKHDVGDLQWVISKNGDHWQGRIIEISGDKVRLKVQTGHRGAGNVVPARISDLRREQPAA